MHILSTQVVTLAGVLFLADPTNSSKPEGRDKAKWQPRKAMAELWLNYNQEWIIHDAENTIIFCITSFLRQITNSTIILTNSLISQRMISYDFVTLSVPKYQLLWMPGNDGIVKWSKSKQWWWWVGCHSW